MTRDATTCYAMAPESGQRESTQLSCQKPRRPYGVAILTPSIVSARYAMNAPAQ